METVIYRQKLSSIVLATLVELSAIALPLAAGNIGYIQDYIQSVFLPLNVSRSRGFIAATAILFGVAAIVFIVRLISKRSYKLEFNREGIKVRYLFPTGTKPFSCLYEDVRIARRGKNRGEIEIVSRSNNTLNLTVRSFQDGDEILDEIERRISRGRVQPNLRDKIFEYQQRESEDAVWGGVAIVVVLLTLIFVAPDKLIARFFAWKTVVNLGEYHVQGFSVNSDDSLAAICSNFDDALIYQKTDDEKQLWQIPTQTKTRFHSKAIAADSNGRLYIFTPYKIGYFDQGKFQLEEFSGDPSSRGMIVNDNRIWSINRSEDTGDAMYYYDLNTREGYFIPLPKDLAGQKIQRLKRGMNGSILALVIKEGETVVLLLRDNLWDEKRIMINEESATNVLDVAMDWSGNVWALREKADLHSVEKYAPDSGLIGTTTLSIPAWETTSIFVDRHERMWIEYKVDSPRDWLPRVGVFDAVWNGIARELVVYSTKNSNFQGGFDDLDISDDGILWSSGKRLVYIDTNQENLPKPLPAWASSYWIPLGIWIALGVAYYFAPKSPPYEKWTPPSEKETA